MSELTETMLDELERLEKADCIQFRKYREPSIYSDLEHLLPGLIAAAREGLAARKRIAELEGACRDLDAQCREIERNAQKDLLAAIALLQRVEIANYEGDAIPALDVEKFLIAMNVSPPAPQARGEAVEESSWVIERGDSEPCAPLYYDGLGWTADHNLAIRHARKLDAERVAVGLDGHQDHRICEHIWSGTPSHDAGTKEREDENTEIVSSVEGHAPPDDRGGTRGVATRTPQGASGAPDHAESRAGTQALPHEPSPGVGELIRRLHKRANDEPMPDGPYTHICDEAADALKQQAEVIEALRSSLSASEGFRREDTLGLSAQLSEARATIEFQRNALIAIKTMKSEPIGDTGFATGPLALFQACQRIAGAALSNSGGEG